MKSGPTTDHSRTLLSMTDKTCSDFSQAVNKKSIFWSLRFDCTILANQTIVCQVKITLDNVENNFK